MSEDYLRRIVTVLRKNASGEWLNEQAVRCVLDMRDDGTRGLCEALSILTSREYLRTRHVGGEWQWMVNMDEPGWRKGRREMTRDELLALRRTCPACASMRKGLGIMGQAHGLCYCHICAGTGYVLPATAEVMALVQAGEPEVGPGGGGVGRTVRLAETPTHALDGLPGPCT
ncbi:MAG: hypothetical protein WC977_10320 [Anaerovoracaceae bacterium]